MKKILVALMIGLASITAYAEASFDQIQQLIEQRNYSAAEKGLEVIIQNHPKSAKAFYAMAQAQAGLGNLEKAQKALDIATGLNPTLDFAPASSVSSLKQAITPQVTKIESVESHAWRNFFLFVMFAAFAVACYFLWTVYARKRDEGNNDGPITSSGPKSPEPDSPIKPTPSQSSYASSYVPPARPAYRSTPRTVTPTPVASTPAPAPAPTPTHTTTVVNNSSNDLLTGVILGNMMSGSHHHDHEVVRERVIEREVPAKSKDSSWDDDSSSSSSSRSSRSSSWDDDSSSSSSKRSSSWDDSSSSSSSSSSSWGSDSSSSSSWDSGSSSSSSSWD